MKRIFDRIILEPFAGSQISEVAEQAILICNKTDCPVDFTFNGLNMRIYYNTTVQIVIDKYNKEFKKRNEIIDCASTS